MNENTIVILTKQPIASTLGILSTYWVDVHRHKAGSQTADSNSECASSHSVGHPSTRHTKCDTPEAIATKRQDRLVDWVVQVLMQYLQQIEVMHKARKIKKTPTAKDFAFCKEGSNLNEVADSIELPRFDKDTVSIMEDYRNVPVSPRVVEQVRDLVASIAACYNDNPFHAVSWSHVWRLRNGRCRHFLTLHGQCLPTSSIQIIFVNSLTMRVTSRWLPTSFCRGSSPPIWTWMLETQRKSLRRASMTTLVSPGAKTIHFIRSRDLHWSDN